MSRTTSEHRKTKETDVSVSLALEGSGEATVETGVGFFDHLLTSFAHHGLFDLTIQTSGDLHIDDHHTVEDTALVLGTAFATALGERAGIARYGHAVVPMDEALASAAVDVGGRPYAVVDLELRADRIGSLSAQVIPHAIEALARTSGSTIHVTSHGTNDHHVAEAAFKALARAMRSAVSVDPRRQGVPSTKGSM